MTSSTFSSCSVASAISGLCSRSSSPPNLTGRDLAERGACIRVADSPDEAGTFKDHACDELDQVGAGVELREGVLRREDAADADDGEALAVCLARPADTLV